jgi:hypothetical protein
VCAVVGKADKGVGLYVLFFPLFKVGCKLARRIMSRCQASTKVDKAPVIMYHTSVAALESVTADVHVLAQRSGVAKR